MFFFVPSRSYTSRILDFSLGQHCEMKPGYSFLFLVRRGRELAPAPYECLFFFQVHTKVQSCPCFFVPSFVFFVSLSMQIDPSSEQIVTANQVFSLFQHTHLEKGGQHNDPIAHQIRNTDRKE